MGIYRGLYRENSSHLGPSSHLLISSLSPDPHLTLWFIIALLLLPLCHHCFIVLLCYLVIVPLYCHGAIISISGPINKRRQIRPGVNTLLPEEYVPVFKALGVTCIVRFNSKCYDRNVFLAAKIRHVDLYYEDGANPPESILQVNPYEHFHSIYLFIYQAIS